MSTQQTKAGGGGGRFKNSTKPAQAATATPDTNNSNTNNSKQKEHSKTEKEKHIKPTAEQIRIAQITDIKCGVEDPKIREKVDQLMEMSQRSEEDVCYALYECDNDVHKAVIYLLETLEVDAFATTSKKKKNRSAAPEATDEEWSENNNGGPVGRDNDNRDRSRGRGGFRGGNRAGDRDRGGSRPAREFRDRDGDSRGNGRSYGGDRDKEEYRGGRNNGVRGTGRGGGFVSRGGRGGRMGGPRADGRPGGRENSHRNNFSRGQQDTQEIDAWDASQVTAPDMQHNKSEDTWGDWDNEEYTGSLNDTKVFTPSTQGQGSLSNPSAPPGLEQQILNPPVANDVQQYNTTVISSTATAAAANNGQYPELHAPPTAAQQLRQALEISQTTSLSAEQSQYFNTLSAQNTGVNAYQTVTGVQYNTVNAYGDQQLAAQQLQQVPVRRQRARVPPPSKIPSSAVEMPGDLQNSMGYLDVQFGGLDFGGTEDSFGEVAEKFNPADNVAQQGNDDYQTKQVAKSGQTLNSSQLSSQLLQNDSLSSGPENLSSSYSQQRNVVPSSITAAIGNPNSALEQLAKGDHYQSNVASAANNYQGSYSTGANKTNSAYQAGGAPGYNSNSYNSQQVSASNYPPATNAYSSYNQNSYQQNQSQNQQSSNVVGVSSNAASQSIPVNNSASSNTNSSYLANQYPVSQQYPSQNAYQSSQSVYGGSTGLSNSGYSASTNQYNNYSSSSKLKETPASSFDGTSNTAANNATSVVTNNSAITTSSISSPSLGITSTKAPSNSAIKSTNAGTGTNASSNTGTSNNNVVPNNMPVVGQFIQTGGIPFYQQQYVQFEDLVPRMTPMQQYYDLNYQTPTSLGAAGVRGDATAANLGSVAYSTMTDGRFARTDNNASPVSNVPSTISQQTGSGGPMINLPTYPAFYYNANMMPGSYQQAYPGVSHIYPQQMQTANATSGTQFAKPSNYSAYGTAGYDTLNQATQDYNKTAYQSAGVGQQAKGQAVSNQTSDIGSSMYSKSHVALNKVNSYDKQSFHSATPPPFNLAGSQTAGSQTAQPYSQHIYLPTIAPHHNMNMHQPIHQMDARMAGSTRRDTNSSGQRQQTNSQPKSTKPGYSPSYWNTNN